MKALQAHRRYLTDKTLLYLFSYDVEASMDREEVGFVPGGVRVNVFARENMSRVYHVARERTLAGVGFQPITGSLVWGGDWLLWRDDDIEDSKVSMAINTDDGAVIHCWYNVRADLGAGGFRRLVAQKGKIGTEDEPGIFSLMTTPRFETTSPRYRWLTEYQCVGFGRALVVRSELRRITYDVYTMM
jgi:Protein of unknown function (DUF3237)